MEGARWTFAHHQLLASTWQPSQTPWLSVVLGWRDIETPESHFRFGEIELQGKKAQMGPFDLASRVGFTEASDAVIQDHRLSVDFGQLTMSSGYADRRSHSALRSEDVYGNFSPSPQTPGWTEAFLAQRERIAEFGADWRPNNRWQHRMMWSQSQHELELLYAGVANRFLASASHRQTNLTYELDSPEHGSKLILSRQGDVLGSTLSASVAHQLLPFRDKEKAIHLHLTWQNRQSYPLWWLLAQETPNQRTHGTKGDSPSSFKRPIVTECPWLVEKVACLYRRALLPRQILGRMSGCALAETSLGRLPDFQCGGVACSMLFG